MKEIVSKVEMVSPDKAKQLLERNPNNRNIVQKRVEQICRVIKDGKWVLNGETIILDSDGALMDGQHRLMAIAKSGMTVPVLIVKGVPRVHGYSIDRGMGRTVNHVLQMEGIKNSALSAAISNMVWQYRFSKVNPTSTSTLISTEECIEIASSSDVQLSARIAKKIYKTAPLGNPTALGFAHYIFGWHWLDNRDRFFDILETGMAKPHESIVIRARDALIYGRNRRIGQKQIDRRMALAILFKSFKCFCSGKNPSVLRVTSNNEFEKDIFLLDVPDIDWWKYNQYE